MISNNIAKGTIVVHKVYGQGIFKSWTENGKASCEFEDDVFEVPGEELTEVE